MSLRGGGKGVKRLRTVPNTRQCQPRELTHQLLCNLGLPGGSAVKTLPATQEMQEMWVQSLGG